MIGEAGLAIDPPRPALLASSGILHDWWAAWCLAENPTGDIQADLKALEAVRPGRHRRRSGTHRRRED